eukprot:CAMPEP_0113720294 /NCGR_PEP_ID=MMETSP0038_2-20120614/36367_1 /TAXON_ID=2898 /ORGANISM="Cryptomonas paramecium" /LENGTH=45 /DNA_ID=CAMNT_0000648915 /DNA_START=363 /DNA_END=496 /DNA_ORIENTATION=- /assembly_acc=CAM_ASM_000170
MALNARKFAAASLVDENMNLEDPNENAEAVPMLVCTMTKALSRLL